MTETKAFQVRDKGTHISIMAVRIVPDKTQADAPYRRSGFYDGIYHLVMKLEGFETHYGVHDWSEDRTMPTAHNYLQTFWNDLKSGDVIDVEFILGETTVKKEPE